MVKIKKINKKKQKKIKHLTTQGSMISIYSILGVQQQLQHPWQHLGANQ